MGAIIEPSSGSALLGGARVLVVEEDFFIALELVSILSEAGAEVVGPSQTVAAALSLADDEGLSAAILDIRLGNDTVAPVADRLAAHHVPFVFYTGQPTTDPLRAEWPDCGIIEKPALPAAIVKAVAALLDRPAATLHSR
jgi:DNA-binding response OmpR family regulator